MRDLASRFPKLTCWAVGSRYDRTGTRTEPEARELVEQAAELTYELAAELWMDGVIGAAW